MVCKTRTVDITETPQRLRLSDTELCKYTLQLSTMVHSHTQVQSSFTYISRAEMQITRDQLISSYISAVDGTNRR